MTSPVLQEDKWTSRRRGAAQGRGSSEDHRFHRWPRARKRQRRTRVVAVMMEMDRVAGAKNMDGLFITRCKRVSRNQSDYHLRRLGVKEKKTL